MSIEIDLPRVPESDLAPLKRRVITTMVREGLEYNSDTTAFGRNVTEGMMSPDTYGWSQLVGIETDDYQELLLEQKDGLNEITTNYLTGMVLTGKWVDSQQPYSESFLYAYKFVQQMMDKIGRKGPELVMKELAKEYMRVTPVTCTDSELPTYLKRTFSSLTPQRIPLWFEPVDLLDCVFIRYVLSEVHKENTRETKHKKKIMYEDVDTKQLVELSVGGYTSWITGQIHMQRDTQTKAGKRLGEKIQTHEILHSLSTSDNRMLDPELWIGKSGLKRFFRVLEE